MAFSLIDDNAGAIPIAVLAKDRLPAWLAEAPERERNWLTATGFGADQAKLALVPDENGRLARVAVGFGQGGEAGAGIWALAGLPDALPEGSYRLENLPDSADPTHLALGWALATYAFTRYRAKKATATALVWPEGADRARVERLAGAIFLARDLANTPAGDLGPADCGEAVRVAKAAGARHQSSSATSSSSRVSDDPCRRPRRAGAPRLVDILWGERGTWVSPGRQGCASIPAGSTKTASGMRLMKKDIAGT
jgi:leucyl aminopeptidase